MNEKLGLEVEISGSTKRLVTDGEAGLKKLQTLFKQKPLVFEPKIDLSASKTVTQFLKSTASEVDTAREKFRQLGDAGEQSAQRLANAFDKKVVGFLKSTSSEVDAARKAFRELGEEGDRVTEKIANAIDNNILKLLRNTASEVDSVRKMFSRLGEEGDRVTASLKANFADAGRQLNILGHTDQQLANGIFSVDKLEGAASKFKQKLKTETSELNSLIASMNRQINVLGGIGGNGQIQTTQFDFMERRAESFRRKAEREAQEATVARARAKAAMARGSYMDAWIPFEDPRFSNGTVRANQIQKRNVAGKNDGRSIQMMYQMQQTIEDFSYAGLRGASNNLAFLAANLNDTKYAMLGLKGILALMAAESIHLFASWASGVRQYNEQISESIDKMSRLRDVQISMASEARGRSEGSSDAFSNAMDSSYTKKLRVNSGEALRDLLSGGSGGALRGAVSDYLKNPANAEAAAKIGLPLPSEDAHLRAENRVETARSKMMSSAQIHSNTYPDYYARVLKRTPALAPMFDWLGVTPSENFFSRPISNDKLARIATGRYSKGSGEEHYAGLLKSITPDLFKEFEEAVRHSEEVSASRKAHLGDTDSLSKSLLSKAIGGDKRAMDFLSTINPAWKKTITETLPARATDHRDMLGRLGMLGMNPDEKNIESAKLRIKQIEEETGEGRLHTEEQANALISDQNQIIERSRLSIEARNYAIHETVDANRELLSIAKQQVNELDSQIERQKRLVEQIGEQKADQRRGFVSQSYDIQRNQTRNFLEKGGAPEWYIQRRERMLYEMQGKQLYGQAQAAGKAGNHEDQIRSLKELQGLQMQLAGGSNDRGTAEGAARAAERTQQMIQAAYGSQQTAAQGQIGNLQALRDTTAQYANDLNVLANAPKINPVAPGAIQEMQVLLGQLAEFQGLLGGPAAGVKLPAVPAHAAGGHIKGQGTGTSDSIMARLSNGEYVMPAARTTKYRHILEQMRSGSYPGYADGGAVDGSVVPGWQQHRVPEHLWNSASEDQREDIRLGHRPEGWSMDTWGEVTAHRNSIKAAAEARAEAAKKAAWERDAPYRAHLAAEAAKKAEHQKMLDEIARTKRMSAEARTGANGNAVAMAGSRSEFGVLDLGGWHHQMGLTHIGPQGYAQQDEWTKVAQKKTPSLPGLGQYKGLGGGIASVLARKMAREQLANRRAMLAQNAAGRRQARRDRMSGGYGGDGGMPWLGGMMAMYAQSASSYGGYGQSGYDSRFASSGYSQFGRRFATGGYVTDYGPGSNIGGGVTQETGGYDYLGGYDLGYRPQQTDEYGLGRYTQGTGESDAPYGYFSDGSRRDKFSHGFSQMLNSHTGSYAEGGYVANYEPDQMPGQGTYWTGTRLPAYLQQQRVTQSEQGYDPYALSSYVTGSNNQWEYGYNSDGSRKSKFSSGFHFASGGYVGLQSQLAQYAQGGAVSHRGSLLGGGGNSSRTTNNNFKDIRISVREPKQAAKVVENLKTSQHAEKLRRG